MLARLLAGVTLVVALAGCMTVGPDYQRPEQPLPDRFLDATGNEPTTLEVEWWRRFNDPILDRLVARALSYNTNVLAAMARIDEADAAYDEAVGGSWPQVNASGSAQRGRQPFLLSSTGFRTGNFLGISVAADYEIDFWGRMRRTREAARAGAVGSRHAADVTRLTVAATVVQTYVNLRALDEQVRFSERTVDSRDEQLRVVKLRLEGGSSSSLDFNQARGLRADAAVQLRELQRQRGIAQNQLARLTGEPGALVPSEGVDDPLSRLPVPPVPPPGMPSTLLARRPDVRLVEEDLVAANAAIGIARAAMLPSISLTSGLGHQSMSLSTLLESGTRIWNIGFGLAAPIFNGGALAARSAQAEARERQLVASYQGTLQTAFQEVSNALVSASAAQVSEKEVLERADAAREAAGLARSRFEGGYSGYLEWLDAERTRFAAELDVIRIRQARLGYAIDLYRAMAGSWPDAADDLVAGDLTATTVAASATEGRHAEPGKRSAVRSAAGKRTLRETRAKRSAPSAS
ncbi:MAG: efflux transporter outer membrane subunit [Burkholderiaceae bacterium]